MTLHELLLNMNPEDWVMLGICGIAFIGACYFMRKLR